VQESLEVPSLVHVLFFAFFLVDLQLGGPIVLEQSGAEVLHRQHGELLPLYHDLVPDLLEEQVLHVLLEVHVHAEGGWQKEVAVGVGSN
jgi:hypothetical protein